MEQIIDLTKKTGMVLWAATVWTWAHLWAATRWTARTTWSLTTWTGRVALWLLCWPVGLWRSVRHGRRQRHNELLRAMRDA